jgi:3-phenylpropionate/cinnamic acid dioxygenase small subunit
MLASLDTDARMRLQFEVEQWLYAEAALLDERRYDEWLGLLADDIHYWMPLRRTTTARETANEFTQPGDMAFFDDDLAMLKMRVQKTTKANPWAEDPPSRTRHFVSNVRLLEGTQAEMSVASNIHLYRTRLESEEDSWIGRREDVLRRVGDEFRLAQRHIFLEQTLILSQNLSSIF